MLECYKFHHQIVMVRNLYEHVNMQSKIKYYCKQFKWKPIDSNWFTLKIFPPDTSKKRTIILHFGELPPLPGSVILGEKSISTRGLFHYIFTYSNMVKLRWLEEYIYSVFKRAFWFAFSRRQTVGVLGRGQTALGRGKRRSLSIPVCMQQAAKQQSYSS